ncbi:MAG: pyridoxamine 5'-phosphate oxidase family protein [bacterium]
MFGTLAQNIIKSNIYLTLGTTNGHMSWVAPVFYCHGEDGCFYFSSQKNSRHIKDLNFTNRVSFAIFDSHAGEGKGNGIQGTGKVNHLSGKSLTRGLKIYHTSFLAPGETKFRPGVYQLYRLKPTCMYVLDPECHVDKRVLVS